MSMQTEVVKEGKVKLKFLRRYLTKKIIIGILILVGIAAVAIGLRNSTLFQSKTTKIGFENIGEFATQTAYCTVLSLTDDSKKLFGFKVPFTQSKYIYSYDVVIKAGFNFEDIEWKKKDSSIEVKLPEPIVLSNEINLESFKIYHEDESIFNQITMTENNKALNDLQEQAKADAIANGLLDNARVNAETLLTSFFGNVYDLNEYEIIFKDK